MFKHCPKCSKEKIEFINDRYFKCSNCEFVYFHNVATATAAIIVYDNEILMTVRAKNPEKGKLDLPGGFVNPNETLEQGLSREIDEELGLKLTNWLYFCGLPNIYTFKDITYYTQDCVFINRLASKPAITIEQSEITDYLWLNMDLLDTSRMAFNSLKTAVERFIQQGK
jgi:ADP-ribose pyrophosphatase YjhB (NUDIX family)